MSMLQNIFKKITKPNTLNASIYLTFRQIIKILSFFDGLDNYIIAN